MEANNKMNEYTQGQRERMEWYDNLCKETGYEPLQGNPYRREDEITGFERLKEQRNKRID